MGTDLKALKLAVILKALTLVKLTLFTFSKYIALDVALMLLSLVFEMLNVYSKESRTYIESPYRRALLFVKTEFS